MILARAVNSSVHTLAAQVIVTIIADAAMIVLICHDLIAGIAVDRPGGSRELLQKGAGDVLGTDRKGLLWQLWLFPVLSATKECYRSITSRSLIHKGPRHWGFSLARGWAGSLLRHKAEV